MHLNTLKSSSTWLTCALGKRQRRPQPYPLLRWPRQTKSLKITRRCWRLQMLLCFLSWHTFSILHGGHGQYLWSGKMLPMYLLGYCTPQCLWETLFQSAGKEVLIVACPAKWKPHSSPRSYWRDYIFHPAWESPWNMLLESNMAGVPDPHATMTRILDKCYKIVEGSSIHHNFRVLQRNIIQQLISTKKFGWTRNIDNC